MPQAERTSDLILGARWVLPVASPPIEAGAVAIRDGRIVRVGKAADLAGDAAPRIELGEAAILPGLINSHSHLELSLLRGFCEELEFFPWIRKLTEAKQRRLLPEDLRVSSLWGALESIRAGITTVGDATDGGLVLDALLASGLRGIAYQEVFGPDDRDCAEKLKALEAAVASQRERATPRVKVGVSPHAPYTVSPSLFRAVARLASRESLPVSIHAAESRAERLLLREGAGPFASFLAGRGIAWKAPGKSTIRYLADLGLLEARPLLVHAVDIDAGDLELIRASGSSIAHCPKSNAKLCHGVAPLLEMLAAEIRTGLGTDGAVSSNNCDLLEEARFAVLLQRSRRDAGAGELQPLDARAALRLLTLGGAEALGMSAEVGSLEPGKLADVVAVDLSRAQPIHDPEAAVVFAATAGDVSFTMVDGRVLYEGGKVRSLDEPSLRRELVNAAKKLRD
jgi:cytosine/adenosine deaminase-related metal-dependent hydrolase